MNRHLELRHGVRGKNVLRAFVVTLLGCALLPGLQAPALAQDTAPGPQQIMVDALSVVKVRSKVVPDARSSATLGRQREGTQHSRLSTLHSPLP